MWAYWRSVSTTRGEFPGRSPEKAEDVRGEMSQGDSRQEEEGGGDTLPDVEPPPDSHWPTARAPDDGGS